MTAQAQRIVIYCVRNRINGKLYVGQTSAPIEKRWTEHKSHAKRTRTTSLLHQAIRKYGADAFHVCTLEEVSSPQLSDEAERSWIVKFGSNEQGVGYNLTDGGNVFRHTIRSKAKISLLKKGNQYTLGMKLSASSKEKIRQARLGKRHSDEVRAKMSIAHKGNKCALGHRHSVETLRRISDAAKRNWKTSAPERRERILYGLRIRAQ